jgi:hypothetical protein
MAEARDRLEICRVSDGNNRQHVIQKREALRWGVCPIITYRSHTELCFAALRVREGPKP